MLSRAEALEAAASTIAREGERIGTPVHVRGEIETPTWFVLLVDVAAGGRSHGIPPVVVDRRDGMVRRPFAAGADVVRELRDVLGADEWIVQGGRSGRKPRRQPVSDSPGQAAAEGAGLRRFRVSPAVHRDDGDRLVATVVGRDPRALAAGLAALGVVDGRWTIGERRVVVSIDELRGTARMSVGGAPGSPWRFDDAAVAAALAIEAALDGAEWIVD